MWIGSNKGLYSFDGYHSFAHFEPGSKEDILINCGMIYKEDYLLLGTEKGLLLYHFKYDKYVPFELEINKDIRSMVLTNNELWLGCADGLYKYHFEKKVLTEVFANPTEKRKFNIVHALVEDSGFIYVGSQGYLMRYSLTNCHAEQFDNPMSDERRIYSMMKDPTRNCIWIGDGNGLTKFSTSSLSFQRFIGFPVVKSIELDADNNLVLGTDNGLCVYNEQEIKYFLHDAQSLILCPTILYGLSFATAPETFGWVPTMAFRLHPGIESSSLSRSINSAAQELATSSIHSSAIQKDIIG